MYMRVSITVVVLLLPLGAGALPHLAPRLSGVSEDASLPQPVPFAGFRAPLERAPLVTEPLEPRPEVVTEIAPLPPLLERMLRSQDPEMRKRSMEGMLNLPPYAAATHLLLLCADPNLSVREAAVLSLPQLDAKELRERLLALMSQPEGAPLLEGDGLLHPLGPSLGPGMLDLFQDPAEPLDRRVLAAYCLGQMRYADAYVPIQQTIWGDESPLGLACVDALYWLDDPRSEQDWIQLASYADPWVQSYAAAALSRTTSSGSIDTLFRLATGELTREPSVQIQALIGLSAWGESVSLPYLMRILRLNPSMEVETINALRKVAGIDVGRFPASWFEWYRLEKSAFYEGERAGQPAEDASPLVPAGEANDLMNTVDFTPPGFVPGTN